MQENKVVLAVLVILVATPTFISGGMFFSSKTINRFEGEINDRRRRFVRTVNIERPSREREEVMYETVSFLHGFNDVSTYSFNNITTSSRRLMKKRFDFASTFFTIKNLLIAMSSIDQVCNRERNATKMIGYVVSSHCPGRTIRACIRSVYGRLSGHSNTNGPKHEI